MDLRQGSFGKVIVRQLVFHNVIYGRHLLNKTETTAFSNYKSYVTSILVTYLIQHIHNLFQALMDDVPPFVPSPALQISINGQIVNLGMLRNLRGVVVQ